MQALVYLNKLSPNGHYMYFFEMADRCVIKDGELIVTTVELNGAENHMIFPMESVIEVRTANVIEYFGIYGIHQ